MFFAVVECPTNGVVVNWVMAPMMRMTLTTMLETRWTWMPRQKHSDDAIWLRSKLDGINVWT